MLINKRKLSNTLMLLFLQRGLSLCTVQWHYLLFANMLSVNCCAFSLRSVFELQIKNSLILKIFRKISQISMSQLCNCISLNLSFKIFRVFIFPLYTVFFLSFRYIYQERFILFKILFLSNTQYIAID